MISREESETRRALLDSFERRLARGDEWVRREEAVQALNSQAAMYEEAAAQRALGPARRRGRRRR